MLPRTLAVLLLECAACLASAAPAAPQSSPNIHKLCVVDELKYSSVESATKECGAGGVVVIPPSFTGTETAESSRGTTVWDLRRAGPPEGLTPVTQFGAKGDAVTGTDGASQAGSPAFTAASASFSAGRDEGKAIVITGAGPENASLTTTIKAVDSANRVTLANPAGFTASGLTYWYGTDNTSHLQEAYGSGKPLLLPPGKFLMTGTVKGFTPLVLIGSREQSVIIDDTTVFNLHGDSGHLLDNFRMEAATKLTALPPNRFPTPHAGTPVALDRIGAGIGYQPKVEDLEVWPRLSKQQQSQSIGPTILSSSDSTHIYRVVGDLISILLSDVQFSEIALCNIRGGKNFVAGIALWHTPHDGRMNRQDSIHDNHVRYASYNGIAWAASEKVSIRKNVTGYNGESGIKNYCTQGDGTYNTNIQVIGNHTEHNHYDGLDLSQDLPHANKQKASSVVDGNTSNFNDRTGSYADGLNWTLTNNVFEGNGLSGMSLDISDSVVSGNTVTRNNTLRDARSHQILIGTGTPGRNNVIEHNRIEAPASSGGAIVFSAPSAGNKVSNNTATGGAVFDFKAAPASARGNADSRGRYPDR